MFEFLKGMYQLGKLNDTTLHQYVDAGRITQQQYQQIIGKGVI